MKTTRILSIALTLAMGMTAGLHASLTEHQPPAPLPEFKTPDQLAKWRAEQSQKSQAAASTQEGGVFYTGKPYLAESGSYAFKYREYNPEMHRWTTVDPSGFPDGANALLYCKNTPFNVIDPLGLFNTGKFTEGVAEFAGGTLTILGGIALIPTGGETFGISSAFGILGILSGGLGVTAGVANVAQGFADTDTWIPASYGEAVGYSVGKIQGLSEEGSRVIASLGGLIESAYLPTGLKETLLTKINDYEITFQYASDIFSGLRSLKPATKDGKPGYE